MADDHRIDSRYLAAHQGILSLPARQAPVAGDLRIVAASLHVIRCMERMGDQCVHIAKLVSLSGYEAAKDKDILDTIERMGRLARSQVSQTEQAFAGHLGSRSGRPERSTTQSALPGSRRRVGPRRARGGFHA